MDTTWNEYEETVSTGAGVYLLYDSVGNVAYVGYSQNLVKRLATHAAGNSTVGEYIKRHAPGSGTWRITVVDGDKQTEKNLIEGYEPPFNESQRANPGCNRILTPPANPRWHDELREEFIASAVDDYIERALVPYPFGLHVGTTLHRFRRQWHLKFHSEYDMRMVFTHYFANMLAGGAPWAVELAFATYDRFLALAQQRIAEVRTFCASVPMPEPDEFGQLPMNGRRMVNARDVALALGIWPEKFGAGENQDSNKTVERRGFPPSMWRPDLGLDQPR